MRMFRTIVASCFLALLMFPAKPTAAQQLTDSAKASVLICTAGDEFYYAFGHAALRVYDVQTGLDVVYNYGTFDFQTPHFYWKFMRGQLDYQLSRSSMESFLKSNRYDGRAVWELPLNYTPNEVRNMFTLLETNYLPQYRYYRYDFLRDNCATRVRDIVEASAGKKTIKLPGLSTTTYRRYLHEAMRDTLEWWSLGVDLLLGLPTDHKCTMEEALFLPPVMMQTYKEAVRGEAALTQPAVNHVSYCRAPMKRSFPPFIVFTLLFAAVVVLSVTMPRSNLMRIVDRVLFSVAGVAGLFLCFMWFGTSHWCTAWNLNILWLSPLLILFAVRMEYSPRWALWLQESCFLAAVVWIVLCGLSIAIIPIIATLAIRLWLNCQPRQAQATASPSRRAGR